MKNITFLFCFLLLSTLVHQAAAQTPSEKIQQLKLTLPEVSQPIGNYVKWKQVGNLLYLAGGRSGIHNCGVIVYSINGSNSTAHRTSLR